MKVISDLHIHSRYSRATSKQLDLVRLEQYAKLKGLNLLGTGDFTHPRWITEIKQNLTERDGFLWSNSGFPFVLQSEISLMYTQGGRGRKVHLVLLAPNLEVVDQITDYFKKFGRVDYDGRPIFGRSCIDVTEDLKSISDDIEIIPAHIWTPWFGLLGSKSGFDSVKEGFGDQTKHIYALETGLSSDPPMNWRLSALDNYTLVSFSDSHSFWPWRIGREATLFELKSMSYANLIKAIRTREGYAGTIEFWPHEGKYHYDGHRLCKVCMSPAESLKHENICPVCGRPLTIGVAHRVELLADRPEGFKPKNAAFCKHIIPLSEIISGVLKASVTSRRVWNYYNILIKRFGSEINVLLQASERDLLKEVPKTLAKMIIKNRLEKIEVKPGFDGEYGEPVFNDETTLEKSNPHSTELQRTLNDF